MECFRDDQIVFDPMIVTENDLHLFMRTNTDTIVGLAESFVDFQVEVGKMTPVECLYDPLFTDVFDLIERLGIKEVVTASMRCMMEEEARAERNAESTVIRFPCIA